MTTTNASNITKLVYDNAINSHQHQIEVLGLELEHASGVRALAADLAMRRGGVDDPDLLFDACDASVGVERLFESYDDPYNTNPTDFVLGEGCPFTSLDAYLDLYELFGDDWLVLAATEYAAHRGSEELRDDPARRAEEMVARAREEFAKARGVKFGRFCVPLESLEAVA